MASALGLEFVDTDAVVEERCGKTIAELFSEQGEAAFRRLEAEVIADAAKDAGQVLSVGGGAVMLAENVTHLREAGVIVWLTAPAEVLGDRIDADQGSSRTRPDLTAAGGLEEVRRILAAREAVYRSAADITVDTCGRMPSEVAAAIMAALPDDRPQR